MNINDTINIIKQCYLECPRSLELYHDYSGMDLDSCIDNFKAKLLELPNYDFKTFNYNGDLVGYYAIVETEIPFLYTFFIRPKYRKTNIVNKYWTDILETIGTPDFMSGVFTSNMPARKFLSRQGGIEVINNKETYFLFRSTKCL